MDDELSVMTWMNNEFLRSCLVAGDGLCTHELHHEFCYIIKSLNKMKDSFDLSLLFQM